MLNGPPGVRAVETSPLGYAPMDVVHAEFDAVLARALDETVDPESTLGLVVEHLTQHFTAEAAWMADTAYQNAECHLDEHAAVLASAREVLALAEPQRAFVARAFFRELAAWFPAHAQHLDSALAHWIVKQSHGGKPVVFHRSRKTPS